MSRLLSVVIPIYNSEDSIIHCIESVLGQTLKDLEIILIDDSSTDNTETFINQYKALDNIRIIRNKTNVGPAKSRTVGLNAIEPATKYVAFLDSDDWLDNDCYEKAITLMENDSRISICFWSIYNTYGRYILTPRYIYTQTNIFSAKHALDMYARVHIQKDYLSPLPGNKVMRHDVITNNKLCFNGWFYDDDIFTFEFLRFSNMVGVIAGCNLYYSQSETSVVHSIGPAMVHEFYEAFSEYKKLLISRGDWEYLKPFFYPYCEKCILNLIRWTKSSKHTDNDKTSLYMNIISGLIRKLDMYEYSNYCDISELFNV